MSLYPLSVVRRPPSGLFRHSAFFILHSAFLLSSAWAGSNLVVNGHFSDTNEFLRGWKYNYEDTGNELFAANHTYVSVTNEGSKQHVLSLRANDALIGIQGVQVDSDPIPVAPGGRYKLTVSAKTTWPDCRILAEGYRWRPGIKPHANPKLAELRKCYRFTQVYFGAEKAGTMGGITNAIGCWSRASQTFPDEKMSKLAQESFNKVQFLVIHIIAIGNWPKSPDVPEWIYLYVDDVNLERINK